MITEHAHAHVQCNKTTSGNVQEKTITETYQYLVSYTSTEFPILKGVENVIFKFHFVNSLTCENTGYTSAAKSKPPAYFV